MLAALHTAYIVLRGNYFSRSVTEFFLKIFLTVVAIIITRRGEKNCLTSWCDFIENGYYSCLRRKLGKKSEELCYTPLTKGDNACSLKKPN